jgi:RND family efflux transporter MFP subunit
MMKIQKKYSTNINLKMDGNKVANILAVMMLGTSIMLSSSVMALEKPATQEHDGHEHQGEGTTKAIIVKKSVADNDHNESDHEHGSEIAHKYDGSEAVHQHVAVESKDAHTHEASEAKTGEEAHEEGISFSPEKMAIAGIEVAPVVPQVFANNLYAPGEIKANGYKSYIVSPRTESVIISRHATLGQHVEKGDALVTLFSESVAEAQANYRVAYNDWQRNKKLGKATVSESRLLSSQTDYVSAYSRLKAFGLTEAAIAEVAKDHSSNVHLGELGEYTLIAQREGAVLSDDFSQGQRVSAGDAIMVLADESELWVEARVSPNKQLSLPKGTQAVLEFGDESFVATVIQEAHTIDPKTRTRIVRLAVKNINDRLHPGMFVNVNFSFSTQTKVMAVPESALMRSSDGDWTVFVEDHPGEFAAVEIELGRSLGAYREIIGLAPQTRIVTKGAFFVASEIAKGGFDPHGH